MTFLKRFRFLTQNVTSLKTNGQYNRVRRNCTTKVFKHQGIKKFVALFLPTRLIDQRVSKDDFTLLILAFNDRSL